MPTVYILLCEQNRYYVGKTERPLRDRVTEHFNRYGSEWTKMYRPIAVIETKPNADEFDEDKYTKMYMKKYGIDKVRGGTYTQIELPEYQVMALEKELCSANDTCFRCHRFGHYAANCYARTMVDGSPIDDEPEEIYNYNNNRVHFIPKLLNAALAIAEQLVVKETPKKHSCFRCGRAGHHANSCYASAHINGKRLYY